MSFMSFFSQLFSSVSMAGRHGVGRSGVRNYGLWSSGKTKDSNHLPPFLRHTLFVLCLVTVPHLL